MKVVVTLALISLEPASRLWPLKNPSVLRSPPPDLLQIPQLAPSLLHSSLLSTLPTTESLLDSGFKTGATSVTLRKLKAFFTSSFVDGHRSMVDSAIKKSWPSAYNSFSPAQQLLPTPSRTRHPQICFVSTFPMV